MTKRLIRKTITTFLLLICSYLAFGTISCLLPNKPIHKNITKTVQRLDLQTDYPQMGIPRHQCQQDNFTDALMLSQAWRSSADSLATSLFLVPFSRGPKIEIQTDCLNRYVNGEDWGCFYYPRYWHGSTFLLRFLLLFTSFITIRLLIFIATSLLLLLVCLRLYKHLGTWAALILVFGLTLTYFFTMQVSMQFASVLIIALACTLHICRCHDSFARSFLTLFVAGSLTAFFDLLTVPTITLGIPLAFWLALNSKQIAQNTWAHNIGTTALMGTSWAMAYLFTWTSKWLLSTLATPMNVFADAGKQFNTRTHTGDFTRLDALQVNLNYISWPLFVLAILALLILVIRFFNKKGAKSALLLFGIGLIPLAWYLFASNHSYIHCWFTYRALMVSLTSWLLAMAQFVDWDRVSTSKFFSRLTH